MDEGTRMMSQQSRKDIAALAVQDIGATKEDVDLGERGLGSGRQGCLWCLSVQCW